MLQIRKNIFETNSSSADRYADDFNDSPTSMKGTQLIHIVFEFQEGFTDEQSSEVIDRLVKDIAEGKDSFLNHIYDFVYDGNPAETIEGDTNKICFKMKVRASITGWEGKHYPQTLESPEEFPEPICEYDEVLPGRNEDFKGKDQLKTDILKSLHEQGYEEIINILEIYGDEVDD